MLRALVLVSLLAALTGVAQGQPLGVLHITVTLTDPVRGLVPVPRHALLISDNPATSAPRRVVTGPDGTADVRLRPGNYTVESDEPVAFGGQGYIWTVTLDISAGGRAVLDLNAANAETVTAPASSSSPEWKESDPAFLLPEWQDSVVAVWTPTARASGFVVDAAGLLVTSQRVVGTAPAVEVQFTPSLKAAARVLVADRVRDVAVLWVDPSFTAPVKPVPLDCEGGATQPFADGQKLVAIGAPFRGPKELSPGEVIGIEQQGPLADFRLAQGSTGGPVFSTGGDVVGISSVVDTQDERRRRDTRIVPVDAACQVLVSAKKAMQSGPRPSASQLPVEPLRPFPIDAIAATAQRRAGNSSPPRMSSSDFDIAFLTPVVVYDAQRAQRGGSGSAGAQQGKQVDPTDFGEWSDYFADVPPVLVIRVTPRLTESIWTTLARGAAYTQGMALPAVKRFKPGFAGLRVSCGDVEVTPIHPFILEQRISETDAIREGLYVFDPLALGPHCTTVTLALSSEKEPAKSDTRVVDRQLVERLWQDFSSYR